ncbi:Syndecan [Aphelenchoides bicaudatus]|nr:Syndecan [Aphelenchoides bicaudatus]
MAANNRVFLNCASVDDEITAPGSGKNPSPGASVDDEDSVPVIEGSGQPPKDIVKPSATSTNRPLTTTSTEPNELKIEDQASLQTAILPFNLSLLQEEDDLDEDDESDDETVDLEPVFKQAEPETTTLPIKTSTSTAATPKQVFELMTRQPPTTTNAPTFPSQIDSVNLDMLRPGLLAAISGGAVVGLLLTILLVMFIVYRMRKKDEGSYSLDEQTNHHQPAHYSYAYQKAPTKEFYA